MDVVSNNIANVNTTGYKSSSVVFEDTLSQMLKPAAAGTSSSGGMNPAQVGLGVQLGGISTNFGQGSAQNTGRSTDLMIQGDGFFVVRAGSQTAYTRAGSFTFDESGTLVTPEGKVVQGWSAANGVVNTDNILSDITLPAGTMAPPVASSTVTAGGNIPAGTTTALTLGASTYDLAGREHAVAMTLTWNGTAYDATVVDTSDPSSVATAGVVAFDNTGAFDAASSTLPTIQFNDGPGGSALTTVTMDMSGVTNYGGTKSIAVSSADGSSSGTLQQFQIQGDGSVVGMFSNGERIVMAKIALANFNNPMGLEKIGETSFRATTNSGLAQIGTADNGGRGDLLGGALEMSNVDLAAEFTNLIIAQRGFQANSRVITTSDQMLQDLVDLKR
jgi:flagellar hook protein FlgE